VNPLRGKTLDEKRYGGGFRPEPVAFVRAPFAGCGVQPCTDPIYGSVEMFVDDSPPQLDWYSRLLAKLPARKWVRMGFCMRHLEDVVARSLDAMDEPDGWAPWRESPPVLLHPPELVKREKLSPVRDNGE
jgi:hypothetical protein